MSLAGGPTLLNAGKIFRGGAGCQWRVGMFRVGYRAGLSGDRIAWIIRRRVDEETSSIGSAFLFKLDSPQGLTGAEIIAQHVGAS